MNLSLDQIKNLRVCFVHDWLVTMRGGEKVLEVLAELFPNAPIFTLFYKKENLSTSLQKRVIQTSFLQWIPGIHRFYRWLLPIFPLAVRSLNVKKYDLVISSSHCVAKGVKVRKDAIHVCYCYTPMRYLWGLSEDYLKPFPKVVRWFIAQYFKWLRKWDFETSQEVDFFIADSKHVQEKILRFYGKQATVIYPPVEAPPFSANVITDYQDEAFFLVVSALVPYKRVDLAIEAFNRIQKPLRIVGDGPLKKALQRQVRYQGIQFEGWLPANELWDRYRNAKALIFPGEEDFGIVPVEAQMCGTPVIAYGKGGVLDTVIPDRADNRHAVGKSTGIFFNELTCEALAKAVQEFENMEFDSNFIRQYAQQFSRERFKKEIFDFVQNVFRQHEFVSLIGSEHQKVTATAIK